jgi:hypothetical protein
LLDRITGIALKYKHKQYFVGTLHPPDWIVEAGCALMGWHLHFYAADSFSEAKFLRMTA